MIDLRKCTFIIPIKVEHEDRLKNLRTTLGYLNHHFITNVILYEIEDPVSLEIKNKNIDLYNLSLLPNLNLHHILKKLESIDFFHRTMYLNEMLEMVETEVVCNYDIDVVLPVESYVEAVDKISGGELDVVYPFSFGASQFQVFQNLDRDGFEKNWDLSEIISQDEKINRYYSEYGHCIFFNTGVYRELGGENENFKSYGPEDKERGTRFIKLDKKVEWLKGDVFHFEHYRSNDSSPSNPNIDFNNYLFSKLSNKTKEELFDYYANVEYRKKYSKMSSHN
jgi:predicted glycosyltransferase involved in capsule biosynthesis